MIYVDYVSVSIIRSNKTTPKIEHQETGESLEKLEQRNTEKKPRTLAILALLCVLLSTVLWPVHVHLAASNSGAGLYITVVLSPVLISAGWVTNFMTDPNNVKYL